MAWFDDQWDKPDRTDHYLMQIAAVIRQKFAANPSSIKPEQFKMAFETVEATGTTGSDAETEMDVETAAKMAKARWFGALRMRM